MIEKPVRPAWMKLLFRLLTIDAAIFGGVGVLCLLVSSWRNLAAYANGLIFVCAGVLAVVVISSYSGWQQTGSFRHQYAMTLSSEDADKRTRRFMNERNSGIGLIFQMIIICALPIAVATLIQMGL